MKGLPFPILLVDDDEDDRLIIDEAFKEIGYEAEIKKFIGGKALLHYLAQVDPQLYPSLIVLDNTLPEMEAKELVQILKKNPQAKSIPVVIYTSFISPSKREELLAAGAYACIEKGAVMRDVVEVAKGLKSLAEAHLKDE
ncbi:MAG: response regulator [Flavisolibacter sp.]